MPHNLEVSVALSPGVVLSGALGVLDFMLTANYVAQKTPGVEARFRPTLVAEGGASVQGSNGIVLAARTDLPDPERVDIAIVPSGAPAVYPAGRIREMLDGQQPLLDWLRAVHDAGGTLASCCTGSLHLAATGLLDGRLATTHWRAEAAFRTLFPRVELRIDSLLVHEPRLLTGGGAQSFSTLVLALVAEHMGEAVAAATARLMLADGRTEGQAAYRQWVPEREHGDEGIEAVQDWLAAHHTEPFDLESLASRFNMTSRTLMRRFRRATDVAPLQYLQRLRVEAARELLETTRLPLGQVVHRVGYEDPASFQRLFRRETGLTPAEYRRRFGGKRYGVAM